MPNELTIAYQLGCKYATAQFKKTAAGAELVRYAPSALIRGLPAVGEAALSAAKPELAQRLTSPLLLGGLGAGIGALSTDETNRLRGAMIGGGIGLGAGMGARKGMKTVLQHAAKPNRTMDPRLLAAAKNIAGGIGLVGGGLAGGVVGRGLAPGHEEKPWTQKLRDMLPF